MTGQERAASRLGSASGSAIPEDAIPKDAIPKGATAAEAAAPGQTQFERRASNLLLVLGVLGLGVAGLVILPSNGPSTMRVVASVLLMATAAAMLLLSFALDRRRPWAPATAAAALWFVLVMGVIRAAVQLAHGGLSIPLDSIAAAWALSGAGRPAAGLAYRPAASLLVLGLVVAGGLWEPVSGMLFTPGASPLAVAKTALQPGIFAACSGEPGTIPSRIHVVGSWTWTSTDLLPSGTDGVGIGWYEAGRETRYRLDPPAASGTDGYLWLGGGEASGGAVERELKGSEGLVTWGVDVDGGGLREGAVSLDLLPQGGDPVAPLEPGEITIRMVYAHLDRWVVSAQTTCAWGPAPGGS
jgi:hypothetical protein